jgi:hypothetical protein
VQASSGSTAGASPSCHAPGRRPATGGDDVLTRRMLPDAGPYPRAPGTRMSATGERRQDLDVEAVDQCDRRVITMPGWFPTDQKG